MAEQDRIARLEAQLAAANLRNQELDVRNQHLEESRLAAELRSQELEESGRAAELRNQELEDLTRNTTFEELLEICHENLFEPFSVEKSKSSTTKKGITNPKKKVCPTELREWEDFGDRELIAFDSLYSLLHPDESPESAHRLFLSRHTLNNLPRLTRMESISSEQDLRAFSFQAVESIVQDTLRQLSVYPEFRQQLHLADRVTFENHANGLTDGAEDVQDHQGEHPQMTKFADQYCVFKHKDGRKVQLFVIEYKPPHKVTQAILRLGLRPMNLPKEVVHRITVPTDNAGLQRYHADQIVAALSTQTYAYMLESGNEFGAVTTGEAIIFLRIDKEDPTILYYHLTEPKLEVSFYEGEFAHHRTAIAQMLSFILMAAKAETRQIAWRMDALESAQYWVVDEEEILRQIPSTLRNSPPYTPAFIPSKISERVMTRSHYSLRRLPFRLRRTPNRCLKTPEIKRSDSNSNSDDDDPRPGQGRKKKYDYLATPTRKGRSHQGGKPQQANWQPSESRQHITRPYCTVKCLLGLIRQSTLDADCPHFRSHVRKGGAAHALTRQELCYLTQRQLARSLDWNCTDLQIYGSRSMVFKVTLASHGYTFIAKGTRDVFVRYLRHEGWVYNRLLPLQGDLITPRLGNIDLDTPYPALGGVRIIHMLLTAYAGERVDKAGKTGAELDATVPAFEAELARFGVQHRDLWSWDDFRYPNILWNEELHRFLFIDFERAKVEGGHSPLLVPDKVRPEDAHVNEEVAHPVASVGEHREPPRKTTAAFDIYEDDNKTFLPSPINANGASWFESCGETDLLKLPLPSPTKVQLLRNKKNVSPSEASLGLKPTAAT